MTSFEQRFKELRQERNLTQKKLAEKFFLNKSSISRYEQGKQVPELELLEKIADFFNVSLDYLLGRTDVRNIEEVHIIAAHHDGDEYTEDELQEIENFKKYVLSKRKKD
ncbi:HTH-type transcriptional regulator ImmR [Andreesenia angusta]|uniref:HTH-type transcriptional regulator ImmR n=1 Tax=Andreesenia angusta TaxID=39480 RepID=A0A1S1V4T1_9FIRM|nr:helix-turn-helix transcriptional regulator [Andreesenia angusta]OHW61686.1 HTH-type transcriptional regulator ImmR [Andreesenia angusta]